jgi:predicted Fe-S protein YdhL (DUF1289 family)
MSSNRTFLLLCLPVVVGAGIIVYRYAAPEPEKKPEVVRRAAPSASTADASSSAKPQARSARSLNLSAKENVRPELEKEDLVRDMTPRAALEEKFRNWRSDGRKLVEDMAGGDREKIGAAFRAALQNQDFKDTFSRSHELEAKWKEASDEEKPAIMQELEVLRGRGLAMLAREMGRISSTGGTGGVTVINGGAPATTGTPPAAPAANGAPAPAPAPVIFQ